MVALVYRTMTNYDIDGAHGVGDGIKGKGKGERTLILQEGPEGHLLLFLLLRCYKSSIVSIIF